MTLSLRILRSVPTRATVAAVAALVSAAAPLRAQSSEDTAVRYALAGFMDALNSLDADRMATFFADEITAFVPVAQADRVTGKAAVTKIFRDFVVRTRATVAELNLVPEDVEVETSRDLAVATFQVHDATDNVVRRRTFVFKRIRGKWLIRHFHASDLALPGR
jgi:ketosteroid isomerase-like protein